MKKTYSILIFTCAFLLLSAEFEIISFEKDLNDSSAANEDTKLFDVNGNICSIIKVQADFDDLSFESSLLEKSIHKSKGEYWIYLPKKAKRLKFNKKGVLPLTYTFPEKLGESMVYKIYLTADIIPNNINDISISIITNPEECDITIDGEKKGSVRSVQVTIGNHDIEISKEFYETVKKKIEVTVSNTLFEFELQRDLKGLVLVEGGGFMMGAEGIFKPGIDRGEYDEYPKHTVILSDYYISKTEVTQSQWESVMGNNPSEFKGDNNPVENVNWYDALEFCNKLSEMEGFEKCYSTKKGFFSSELTYQCNFEANGYRLPTEAEWEFGARGGNKSEGYKFSGSSVIYNVAWFENNSENKTNPVGTKDPNELGLFDMSGNVEEWCWDWYGEEYYKVSPYNDPKGPDSGEKRIQRGDCYWGRYLRVADRGSNYPERDYQNVGFRIARKQLIKKGI